jgi:hypothetical protein
MSSLQNKLINYEVAPPAEAWDRITAALDADAVTPEYPSRLYNLELAPPAPTWSNISSALDEADPRIIPTRKRTASFYFYRYAVAAAFVIIAALGVIKWLTGNSHSDSAGMATITSSNDSGIPGKSTVNGTPTVPDDQTPVPGSSVKREPAMLVQADQPVKTRLHKINASGASAVSYRDEPAVDIYDNPIYAYEDHVPNLADRYIMLMTPEGKFIRMSKKWGSLVCCVSGEEQDADCKDQLKKWQEKIAAAPLSASTGNFLDILSLVNSLDDSNGL